ncbi:hypothetical protein ZORO111902_19360 [Zobellia roscoffensis]
MSYFLLLSDRSGEQLQLTINIKQLNLFIFETFVSCKKY